MTNKFDSRELYLEHPAQELVLDELDPRPLIELRDKVAFINTCVELGLIKLEIDDSGDVTYRVAAE